VDLPTVVTRAGAAFLAILCRAFAGPGFEVFAAVVMAAAFLVALVFVLETRLVPPVLFVPERATVFLEAAVALLAGGVLS
jgi:hypothetical protein